MLSYSEALQKYGDLYKYRDLAKHFGATFTMFATNSDFFNNNHVRLKIGLDIEKSEHTGTKCKVLYTQDYFEAMKAYSDSAKFDYHRYMKDSNYLMVSRFFGQLRVKDQSLQNEILEMIGEKNLIKVLNQQRIGEYTYFVLKNVIHEIRYRSIESIGKDPKFPLSLNLLKRVYKHKLISQPEHLKETALWDFDELKRYVSTNINHIYAVIQEDSIMEKGNKKSVPFNYLNPKQQQLINQYLTHRTHSQINYETNSFSTILEHQVKTYRELISKILFDVIAGRCGLEFEKPTRLFTNNNQLKLKKFNPDILDLTDYEYGLKSSDFSYVSTGYAQSTIRKSRTVIQPFLLYILWKTDEDINDLDPEELGRFTILKKRILSFINSFPKGNSRDKKKRNKSLFLTREQILLTNRKIIKNSNFKNSVRWMLGAFAGLRPFEINQVSIEDFELTDDGFLKTDEKGYGRLYLPAEKSKGGYSPSPEYGTLVVPRLVLLINEYLREEVYSISDVRGTGPLIRHDHMPTHGYTARYVHEWAADLSGHLTFLSDKEKDIFELKTSRRSMHNNIFTFPIKDYKVNDKKEWAAQVHMRHDTGDTVAKEHYTSELPFDDYFAVIDETLNFPWDLTELKEWEKEKGLHQQEEVIEAEPKDEVLEQIKSLELEIEQLGRNRKGMDISTWLETMNKKEATLRALKKKTS